MDTQPAQKETRDDDLRLSEYAAKRRREDLLDTCRRAVECLERFAAQARLEVERAEADPSRLIALPGEVLSAATWGAANASSELTSATRIAAEYVTAVATVEALKGCAR